MPKRFTSIGAILFGVIAAAQATRIYFGLDVSVGSYHVPMMMSWIVAIVSGLLCLGLFKDAAG